MFSRKFVLLRGRDLNIEPWLGRRLDGLRQAGFCLLPSRPIQQRRRDVVQRMLSRLLHQRQLRFIVLQRLLTRLLHRRIRLFVLQCLLSRLLHQRQLRFIVLQRLLTRLLHRRIRLFVLQCLLSRLLHQRQLRFIVLQRMYFWINVLIRQRGKLVHIMHAARHWAVCDQRMHRHIQHS